MSAQELETTKPAEVTCEIWAKPGFNITTSPEGERERKREKWGFVLLLSIGVYHTGGAVSGFPDQSPGAGANCTRGGGGYSFSYSRLRRAPPGYEQTGGEDGNPPSPHSQHEVESAQYPDYYYYELSPCQRKNWRRRNRRK
jgi:hypothetical protein